MESELSHYLPEIINTMSEGLFCTRTDGVIVLANDALSRITGYDREELLNRPCAVLGCDACEISRAAGGSAHCTLFLKHLENRKNCRLRRKDGTLVHVLKNACLLRDGQGTVIGAVETITDITELDVKERRIRQLARNLETGSDFHGMLGRSRAMREVYNLIEKAACVEAPVLILGESGVGKELAAQAIHELGPRAKGPYVQVNCAALNDSLLESELFGHARGAFTGAYRHRIGRFEEVAGGDLFLDEIGDVPLGVQVKLLRVLETRKFERVGDSQTLSLDARLIAATNQDLPALVAAKRFREDFYFRVNVLPIWLPPLRERSGDVGLLAAHFLEACRKQSGKDIGGFAPETAALLEAYSWPGNVRELKSAIEYAAMVIERGAIEPSHLPPHLSGRAAACRELPAAPSRREEAPGDQKSELLAALRQCQGNQTKAAALLGVSRLTVINRMRKYGVTRSIEP
ncbi:MAG: sigma-54 interaction domain-containing protein [Acidobacteriota bacterium]